MSALPEGHRPLAAADAGRPRLRLVRKPGVRAVGRIPFMIIVTSLLVLGMVGLLLLNTQLQNQSFEANRLKRQAADLSYKEGELQQQLIEASSEREVNRRATALGLRPNRGIAYVDLGQGRITGIPHPADPNYMPEQLTLTPEEIKENNRLAAIDSAERRAAAEQKAADAARQRVLDARAKAEADARAKAEADARAKGQSLPPTNVQPNDPKPNQPPANQNGAR